MTLIPTITGNCGRESVIRRSIGQQVTHCLRLTFISGPKALFTLRISGKCVFLMALMCAPLLICCIMLTVPGLLFQMPYQQGYYYFSKVLEEDPVRWLVLWLAGICALMSLAVPAATCESNMPTRR